MFKKTINKILGKESVSSSSNDLVFKDNESAFQYACNYCDTKLSAEKLSLAIVQPGPLGKDPIVLETGIQRTALMVASPDGGFFVISDTLNAKGPKLKVGDLVAWLPAGYAEEIIDILDDPRSGMVGFIIGTIKPILSDTGWVGKEKFLK